MRIFLIFLAVFALPSAALAQSYEMGLQSAPQTKYGAIPRASSPLLDRALPASFDLSADMPLPGRQVDQSCVGWATAYALKTFQERKERGWSITRSDGAAEPNRTFSPSFVYNQINGGVDEGSHFGNAFNLLATQGAAPLSAMPYSGNPFEPVPAQARSAATPFRIDTFRTVDHSDESEVKAQLVAGFPVVIGAKVFPNFEQLGAGEVWRQAQGQFLGNHAMVVVGYDNARGAFKVINSWGQQWGTQGYGWIDYNLFKLVVNEAYVVIDLEGVDAVPVEPDDPNQQVDVWVAPEITPQNSQIVVAPFCNGPFCTQDLSLSQHNFFNPTTGEVGMHVAGMISIPPGVVGTARIVIPLSYANGVPVGSLSPFFALPSGQAAFGTPPLNLDGSGLTTTWYAFIPYCAIDVPKAILCLPYPPVFGAMPAQSNLRADPVLFIDNFGVATGPVVPFFVRL